jgi:quinol monooxygenase YgiN
MPQLGKLPQDREKLGRKPGAEAQLEEVLKSLIEPTREETGCIDYTLHRDLEEPGAY